MRVNRIVVTALILFTFICASSNGATPPINVGKLQGATVIRETVNPLGVGQILESIKDGRDGLLIDFSGVTKLLNGTRINSDDIHGFALYGPARFTGGADKGFAGKRYRSRATIEKGRGLILVDDFLSTELNTEGWRDRGALSVRFQLFLTRSGADESLGTYETRVGFLRSSSKTKRIPCVTEGPFVNMSNSDGPSELVISFKTDLPTRVTVTTDNNRTFTETPPNKTSTDHIILVTGLKHGTAYKYKLNLGNLLESDYYSLKTAPVKGRGSISFGLCGGSGGGLDEVMGVNTAALERNIMLMRRENVDFCLFSGNMFDGFTTSPEDYETLTYAWKRAVAPLGSERVVYPVMGLGVVNAMRVKVNADVVRMDRWPYGSRSAETIFRKTFLNPLNGPKPANEMRPSYSENAFSFHYGPVKVIVFNTRYWYSENPLAYGGCPPGYVMADQLEWILSEVKRGDMDLDVRYIFLCSEGPMLPCGDAGGGGMWRDGDNKPRAVTFKKGGAEPAKLGLLQTRDALLKAITSTSKVVAVLSGGEPCYYRMFLTDQVPIGNPDEDDSDKNGVIEWKTDEKPSPLRDAKYGVWFIASGNSGAPYCRERETPWTNYWKAAKDPGKGYFFSSCDNAVTLTATARGVSLKAFNSLGEVIDEVPNLLDGKLLPKPKKKGK